MTNKNKQLGDIQSTTNSGRYLTKNYSIYLYWRMDFYADFPSLRLYCHNLKLKHPPQKRAGPAIENEPLRTIECSSISDDFYSNLIDWSGQNVYYSIENVVLSYNFYTEVTQKLLNSSTYNVTSIKHSPQNNMLCVGTASGILNLVDIPTGHTTRHIYHKSRVGALETYGSNLITGSRDRKSKVIDLRVKLPVLCLGSHFQEVCGLSLNTTSTYLASGGNDNKVFVFDLRESSLPFASLGAHQAAVKALSWSPSSTSQFVTGGGTADKTIKHWDLNRRVPLVRSYNFEGQICNLKWLKNNSILSTFGYSNDDIKLLSNFKTTRCYRAHKNRVIHFAVDDTETFFVSGSSDSTIRFWQVSSRTDEVDVSIR